MGGQALQKTGGRGLGFRGAAGRRTYREKPGNGRSWANKTRANLEIGVPGVGRAGQVQTRPARIALPPRRSLRAAPASATASSYGRAARGFGAIRQLTRLRIQHGMMQRESASEPACGLFSRSDEDGRDPRASRFEA